MLFLCVTGVFTSFRFEFKYIKEIMSWLAVLCLVGVIAICSAAPQAALKWSHLEPAEELHNWNLSPEAVDAAFAEFKLEHGMSKLLLQYKKLKIKMVGMNGILVQNEIMAHSHVIAF